MLKKVAPRLPGGRATWHTSDEDSRDDGVPPQHSVLLQNGGKPRRSSGDYDDASAPGDVSPVEPSAVSARWFYETVLRHVFLAHPDLRTDERLVLLTREHKDGKDAHDVATMRKVLREYQVPPWAPIDVPVGFYVAARDPSNDRWRTIVHGVPYAADSPLRVATGWADLDDRYYYCWMHRLERAWVTIGQPYEVSCSNHEDDESWTESIDELHSDTPVELLEYALTLHDEAERMETAACARKQLKQWHSNNALHAEPVVLQTEFDRMQRAMSLFFHPAHPEIEAVQTAFGRVWREADVEQRMSVVRHEAEAAQKELDRVWREKRREKRLKFVARKRGGAAHEYHAAEGRGEEEGA